MERQTTLVDNAVEYAVEYEVIPDEEEINEINGPYGNQLPEAPDIADKLHEDWRDDGRYREAQRK